MSAFYANLDFIGCSQSEFHRSVWPGADRSHAQRRSQRGLEPARRAPAGENSRYGQIAPIGDSRGLAEAVLEVLDHPEKYQADAAEIARRYDPDTIAFEYEKLFDEMQRELQH